MLCPFAHPVACSWMLLCVVAQSLKPVKLFSPQLPTFLLFCDHRSIAQQCWIRLHSSPTLLGLSTLITHGSQRLMSCILLMMHCRSQTCWELLQPFACSLRSYTLILCRAGVAQDNILKVFLRKVRPVLEYAVSVWQAILDYYPM